MKTKTPKYMLAVLIAALIVPAFVMPSVVVAEESTPEWIITVVKPTCSAEGYTELCHVESGGKWYSEYVPALGHRFEFIQSEGGRFLVKCSVCDWQGYISDEYTTYVVEPTCTAEGYTALRHVPTGNEWYSDYVPAFGHTFETLYREGDYLRVLCSVCDWEGYIYEPEGKTSAEWRDDITNAINTALSNTDSSSITTLIIWEGKTTVITLTIDDEAYRFTGGNGQNSDKTIVIDGVTYIISIQGNGNWRVLSRP
ncbi:MAG: hypothetical protein LBH74_05675 [Nitrososphaerota archaeon]|jgi:hypothetical protein|nr:hypothetical protein [Nitrososphaerota archaeon]